MSNPSNRPFADMSLPSRYVLGQRIACMQKSGCSAGATYAGKIVSAPEQFTGLAGISQLPQLTT